MSGFFYTYSSFSLKAEGKSFGMNLIMIGSSKLPPGNKNIVSDGTVLQMSSNCFLIFFFSSLSKSLWVDLAKSCISSLLSEISLIKRFLFLLIRTATLSVVWS